VAWHDTAAFTAHGRVFDTGISTAKAVRRLKSGIPPEEAGCAGADENGSGGLMRIAPPVFYLDGRPEADRFKITRAVSSITHAHIWPVAACYIYLEYLLKLLSGEDKAAAYASLRDGFSNGSPYIDGSALDEFSRLLRGDIGALPESAIRSGGFVTGTLEAAFWCFLTTDSYPDAVLKAASLGDDTDTTAAVAGALAGLYYGRDAVPADWLQKLAGADTVCRWAAGLAHGV
jgi:ADP-ribosylglycohydrolase